MNRFALSARCGPTPPGVRRFPQPAGFTLIELLVVITILALLMSILLPSLSGARRSAQSSACLSNLKRLGVANTLYLNGNADRFMPFRLQNARPSSTDPYVNEWGRSKPRWQWFLGEEEVGPVIDPEPFREEIETNGSFGDSSIGISGQSGRAMTNKYFLCPSLGDDFEYDIRNGAYGYNYQYLGNSRLTEAGDRWCYFPAALHTLRSASSTVLIADSRGAGKSHGQHSYSLDPPRMAVERNADSFGPGASDVPPGLDPEQFAHSPVEMRHGGKGNVVFLDGHAEPMNLETLGYQQDEKGHAVPIVDPENGTYTATNKLWNGQSRDDIASEHRP